ncbi:MAG: hypothetical protein EHM93_02875 [Bacteroidales bacterium]|nr:MAG: hypothetical protein EHM93_02875 [Bacteroidales bacterium]
MRLLTACIIMIAIFSQCTPKDDNAQWRGPERTGIYPEKNLLTQWPDSGPKLLWRFDELGQGYASAAVTSNRVYTIGTVDSISYVFTFDTNGKLLWKKDIGPDWMINWPGVRSTPNIHDGLGYILNGLGVLICFSADNGDIVWQRDILKEFNGRNTEFGLSENLLIDGDKLFCTPGGIENNVVALNRKTGETIWTSKANSDSTAYCTPILIETGGKKFFINQTDKSIFSLNAENGELAWKRELKTTSHPSTPVYRNGLLFAIDGGKSGSMMLKISENGSSISEVWQNADLNSHFGHVVVLGDNIYGLCRGNKTFGCVDWNTGKQIVADSTKSRGIAVISDGEMLYNYDLNGEFKLVKPLNDKFETKGSFKVKGGTNMHFSHPVIKDGKLYIRHDNSLFVYDVAKK